MSDVENGSRNALGWDETVDVVVVGAGAAGLAASVGALLQGARTVTLEKDPARIGGTMRKAIGAMWVPNNKGMRDAGIGDPRDEALKYMARLSRPGHYSPEDPHLGLAPWEYEMISAFYDNVSRAIESMEEAGALFTAPRLENVDFFDHLAETEVPLGRVRYPGNALGAKNGGEDMAGELAAAIDRMGGEIRLGHAATGVVRDDDGSVLGLEAEGPGGKLVRIRTTGGVVFGSGGFARNATLRNEYLTLPYVQGCSAITNTGDFVYIARRNGAHLVNMGYTWTSPIVLERAFQEPDEVVATFYFPGDGFIIVNRFGRRALDEKAVYNEFTRVFFETDPQNASYPNLPMIVVWDEEQARRFSDFDKLGNPFAHPDDESAYWVCKADNLDELAVQIQQRLEAQAASIGSVSLDKEFVETLGQTLERYNEMASRGVDEDFNRGGTTFEQFFTDRCGPGDGENPTLRPVSGDGPFYATVIGPSAFETKGGPRIDPQARVMDVDGEPIPGLYAAGNCSASPSVEAYWSAGISIGLAYCFGFIAGEQAAERSGERISLASKT